MHLGVCIRYSLNVLYSFAIILRRKGELIAYYFIVFLSSSCVSRSAMSWSAVYDCGISWSYSIVLWVKDELVYLIDNMINVI